MISTGTHRQRRERLAALVGEGIAIVPTAPERFRNRDSTYPYRFDSYFYYLTGFPEPEAVLVIVCGAHPRSLLFCRDKNPERELWDGFRHGPDAAREAFGFDEAHSIDLLDEQLPKLLGDRRRIAYAVGADAAWDARVMDWLNRVRAAARAGVHAPTEIADIRAPLDEMRLVKDAEELDVMRAAARISASAHRRAMAVAGPGMHEHEIEAELLHEFRRRGAQFPAYSPIVASGANACILHYVENRACIAPGSLLLIDAGCELDGYAADITRTFPVDGRFSGPQRDIYELVLEAQAQAIRAVRPGATFADPHDAAVGVLVRGLIDLGLLQGSAEAAIESESYTRFYMHRTGHWLGLDVHDAGEYKRDGRWRELAPGMVLTVEPGLYVR
ncbi:MAG: aminopeptidase P N-terminal domain-containing protein, partial [Vicinamibacterales bacterium]